MTHNDEKNTILFTGPEETSTIAMFHVALEESAVRELRLRKYLEQIVENGTDPVSNLLAKRALGYHKDSLNQESQEMMNRQKMARFLEGKDLPLKSQYDDVYIEYNPAFPGQWRDLEGERQKKCTLAIRQLMREGPARTAQKMQHRIVPAQKPRIVPDNCIESTLNKGVRLYWQLEPEVKGHSTRKISVHSLIVGGVQLGDDPSIDE